MKNQKHNHSLKKEARMKLNSKLVKKFGFEQKFLIKEVLDSVLSSAKPQDLSALRVLSIRSETEIKKRLMAKQTAKSQKKKLNFLNSRSLIQEMERMRKQKGKKVKSKFKSALMSEFSKKVFSKKTPVNRGNRRIQTVQEIQEEGEVGRDRYYTEHRRAGAPGPDSWMRDSSSSKQEHGRGSRAKGSILQRQKAHTEAKKRSMIRSRDKQSRVSRGSKSFRKNQESSMMSIRKKNSSKHISRESNKKQSRSSSKKKVPRVNPEKLQDKFREFQRERDQQASQLRDSKGGSNKGNSYLSGWSQKQQAKQMASEYGKRKEFLYGNSSRQKRKPRMLRKSVKKKKQREQSNEQCGSVTKKGQRISISTKAITETNAGAEAELMDDEELVKFMVIKKNKIKQIKQQSLITLAELKRKKPAEEQGKGGMVDIEVENVVMQEKSGDVGTHFGSKKYHNPRNSLALLQGASQMRKRRKSRELKCKTKDIKVQEYFLNSDFENSGSEKVEAKEIEVELESESKRVKVDEGLEVFMANQIEPEEDVKQQSVEEMREGDQEAKREELGEKNQARDEEIRPKAEEQVSEEVEKETTESVQGAEQEDKPGERETERATVEKLEEHTDTQRKEMEMIQKMKANLKVMRKTFDFGQKDQMRKSKKLGLKSPIEIRGMPDEPIEEPKNAESRTHYKEQEAESKTVDKEPEKTVAAELKDVQHPEKDNFEDSILENIEKMSEADIIKNGQKIILKNLNNKEFIKQVLSEVKKIKKKEKETSQEIPKKGGSPGERNSKENSEAEANLSIITLGSDTEDFDEDDELIEEMREEDDRNEEAVWKEQVREMESKTKARQSGQSAEIKSSQNIVVSRNSLPVTETTQGSLFQWSSNYNDEAGSVQKSKEALRSHEERTAKEDVKELQVSQYQEVADEPFLDRDLFHKLGTFRKHKMSTGKDGEEAMALPERQRKLTVKSIDKGEVNFERIKELQQSNLEENLAKLKKNFEDVQKSLQEIKTGRRQKGVKQKDFIDNFGHLMDTRNTDEWGESDAVGQGGPRSGNSQGGDDSHAKEVAEGEGEPPESPRDVIEIRDADREDDIKVPYKSVSIEERESVSDIEISHVQNRLISDNEDKQKLENLGSGKTSDLEIEESAAESNKTDFRKVENDIRKASKNNIEEIKKKLKHARQNEEDLESSHLSEFKDHLSVDSKCSIESEYKESSVVSTGDVHSLEDCELFIVRLTEILRSASLPRWKSSFRRILRKAKSRAAKRKKRTERGERASSKKKVIIKKRTLKGTELEKINLRNKSYSG